MISPKSHDELQGFIHELSIGNPTVEKNFLPARLFLPEDDADWHPREVKVLA